MSTRPVIPDRLYALHLRGQSQPAGQLQGRVEHVLSGRCVDFSDKAGLLACLLDALVPAAAKPPTDTPSAPMTAPLSCLPAAFSKPV